MYVKHVKNSQWRTQDFPEGVPTLQVGASTHFWQNFYRKLRENERNWTEREARITNAPAPWIRQWLICFSSPYINFLHYIFLSNWS